MSDLIAGRANLSHFKGLIAVGGFSYGDVLGAGEAGQKRSCLMRCCLSNSLSSSTELTHLVWVFVMVVR
jgi:phosphoribosylformylglycinamidine (FGAM) synthase-like amidotransferase family enzyme